jgi:hypothetical protein
MFVGKLKRDVRGGEGGAGQDLLDAVAYRTECKVFGSITWYVFPSLGGKIRAKRRVRFGPRY